MARDRVGQKSVRPSRLFCGADEFLDVGQFLRHTGGENLGAIVGDEDGVLDTEVQLLVGELDDGLDGRPVRL